MTLDQLAARLEAIHRQYTAHFAGQPRATRDLSLLEAIIAEIDETLKEAQGLTAEGVSELIESLNKNKILYTKEAQEILLVRNDPKAQHQDELMIWLGVVTGRYQRFFANQSRVSRDLGLLNEIAEDAERVFRQMEALEDPGLKEITDSLRSRKKLYASEIAAVQKARAEAKPEHLAGHLANMANTQFAVYDSFFVNKNRLSRRPNRLIRVIGNLKAILGRDILQLPVLLQLKPVSIAASFQFVDVRAIENQVPKAH